MAQVPDTRCRNYWLCQGSQQQELGNWSSAVASVTPLCEYLRRLLQSFHTILYILATFIVSKEFILWYYFPTLVFHWFNLRGLLKVAFTNLATSLSTKIMCQRMLLQGFSKCMHLKIHSRCNVHMSKGSLHGQILYWTFGSWSTFLFYCWLGQQKSFWFVRNFKLS